MYRSVIQFQKILIKFWFYLKAFCFMTARYYSVHSLYFHAKDMVENPVNYTLLYF